MQRSNKTEFRLVNNQRNSQIANQMLASDVATFGYAENQLNTLLERFHAEIKSKHD